MKNSRNETEAAVWGKPDSLAVSGLFLAEYGTTTSPDCVNMSRIRSFQPIENKNARVLILGSMPGVASLAAGQYYAHAQNAFWRIVTEILKLDAASPYAKKVQALKAARIAVWDVLQSCLREGSLDSMIERDTQVANDFRAFFRAHPGIRQVFFNGAKAEECFRRQVLPKIDNESISYLRLPSTSPANASLSFENKLKAWRAIMASGGAFPRTK